MAVLPITSLLVAAFAIALVALSFPISLRRLKVGDMVGDSADEVLHRRIRAQGNFIEYVPLGLITIGLVEAHAAPVWIVAERFFSGGYCTRLACWGIQGLCGVSA
jgi:uncharacterized membrane protein YecN with MAPEG domain